MICRRHVLPFVVLVLSTPFALSAQPTASERGRVTQVINGTTITIDYSRPVARGRTNLFGGVVHWGEMWTPGANWATTFEVNKSIQLNGHSLQPGKYSVWMQPQPEEWTVFLHRKTHIYHDTQPSDAGMQLSFKVKPEEGGHMETLAWYFPVIGTEEATIRMHWGSTYVTLSVATSPFEYATPPAAQRAQYVGTYRVSGNDPTTGAALSLSIAVLEEEGRLVGRWGRAPVVLIPAGEHQFYMGFSRNGKLFSVGTDIVLRMVMGEDGRASGIEMVFDGTPFADGARER